MALDNPTDCPEPASGYITLCTIDGVVYLRRNGELVEQIGTTLAGEDALARLQNLKGVVDTGFPGGRKTVHFDSSAEGGDSGPCSEDDPCETLTRAADFVNIPGIEIVLTGTFDNDGAGDDDFGQGIHIEQACDDPESLCTLIRRADVNTDVVIDCVNSAAPDDGVILSNPAADGGYAVIQGVNVKCDEDSADGYDAALEGKMIVIDADCEQTDTTSTSPDQCYTPHGSSTMMMFGDVSGKVSYESVIRSAPAGTHNMIYIGKGVLEVVDPADATNVPNNTIAVSFGGDSTGSTAVVIGPTIVYNKLDDDGSGNAAFGFAAGTKATATVARVVAVGPNDITSGSEYCIKMNMENGDDATLHLYQNTCVGQDRGVGLGLLDTAGTPTTGSAVLNMSAVLFKSITARLMQIEDGFANTNNLASGTWTNIWFDQADVASNDWSLDGTNCNDWASTDCYVGSTLNSKEYLTTSGGNFTVTGEVAASSVDPFVDAANAVYMCDPSGSCYGAYDSFYVVQLPDNGIPPFVLGRSVRFLTLNGPGGNIGGR
jgi:hypothetical protein